MKRFWTGDLLKVKNIVVIQSDKNTKVSLNNAYTLRLVLCNIIISSSVQNLWFVSAFMLTACSSVRLNITRNCSCYGFITLTKILGLSLSLVTRYNLWLQSWITVFFHFHCISGYRMQFWLGSWIVVAPHVTADTEFNSGNDCRLPHTFHEATCIVY